MKNSLYDMLLHDALAKRSKAILTLDLMTENPVGIGDHSTDDFYNNAIEAIKNLADANDELETIHKYFKK
tara:strand:- start:660 stop:869 length:210 start_codon:yes stop_codon:yes gene_type:complete